MQQLNPLPRVLPIQAVLFDWAGTTIDYGSCAPAAVFIEIFRQSGIEITAAEARGPMGLAKRDHIAAVASLPRVSAAWKAIHGAEPKDVDIDAMYRDFLPLQKQTLLAGCELIPGVAETLAWCRARGLKIGASTGYTRELMSVVEPAAAALGYIPDASICSDECRGGRPAPWMNYRLAEELGVYPMNSIVVVDDTPIGIEAGLNAGAITVAVTQSGNMLGLTLEEASSLPKNELDVRLGEIEEQFRRCGAHFAIRSAADLPLVLERLATAAAG